ncbi:MAG: RNA polymerase sigma factor [Anaerolineae bacterium]
MVDETQLIQKAKNGDRDALGQLYDTHQPSIFRYIAYRIGDRALAEDLTAEVFVTMVKKLPSYQDRGKPLLAWLYTIAGNIIKMHYRKHKHVEFNPFSDEMIDQQATPDQVTDKRLAQAKLLAQLPRLTAEQSEVITLKFLEGFSNGEIAKLLGKTEGSIKALQHRALQTLKGFLVEEAV